MNVLLKTSIECVEDLLIFIDMINHSTFSRELKFGWGNLEIGSFLNRMFLEEFDFSLFAVRNSY